MYTIDPDLVCGDSQRYQHPGARLARLVIAVDTQEVIYRVLRRRNRVIGGDVLVVDRSEARIGYGTRFRIALSLPVSFRDRRACPLGIAYSLHQPLKFRLYVRIVVVKSAVCVIAHGLAPFRMCMSGFLSFVLVQKVCHDGPTDAVVALIT
jgi:hypothetical protein